MTINPKKYHSDVSLKSCLALMISKKTVASPGSPMPPLVKVSQEFQRSGSSPLPSPLNSPPASPQIDIPTLVRQSGQSYPGRHYLLSESPSTPPNGTGGGEQSTPTRSYVNPEEQQSPSTPVGQRTRSASTNATPRPTARPRKKQKIQ